VVPEHMVLEIGDLNHRGEGVGRWHGMVVFVSGAVPGDRVRVTAVEGKKNYLRGRLEEILQGSPRRVRPRCPFFGRCGGCHLQHLGYPWQLEYKTRLVYNVLRRLGGLPECRVLPALGMERPWYYRNKAEFKVGIRDGRVVLGFFAAGTHVVARGHEEPLECHLLDHDLMALARACEEFLNRYPELHAVREVTLRKAVTGETMVVLEGAGPVGHPAAGRLVEALAERAGVTTVVARRGGKVEVLFGPGYITERLEDLVFRLSAPSFYQVNPAQVPVLYSRAREYARLTGTERVLDAYCGVGTIALFLARKAREVVGVEKLAAAAADARQNAILNGLQHVSFLAGAAEEVLPRLLRRGHRPDVVVLDPPRGGCHPVVLEALARHAVPRVVYLSCHPGTLARDLGRLVARGYRLAEVQPVDMFPQTHHVECVALLEFTGQG